MENSYLPFLTFKQTACVSRWATRCRPWTYLLISKHYPLVFGGEKLVYLLHYLCHCQAHTRILYPISSAEPCTLAKSLPRAYLTISNRSMKKGKWWLLCLGDHWLAMNPTLTEVPPPSELQRLGGNTLPNLDLHQPGGTLINQSINQSIRRHFNLQQSPTP